ncbi:MAG: protease HtpX [Methylomonas sp.]|jgi:heat shock protein HtpX
MLRILLFLATNIAILIAIGVLFSIFGIQGALDAQGVNLDLPSLLLMSAIIGMTGATISLFMSKWSAKNAMGVVVIEQPQNQTEQWLVDTVSKLAKVAGVGMPEVGIFDSPEPNAFATGANRNNALVAVSTGLLQTMSADEVEAVLGHEMTHVSNGDMVTMTLIQGVVNTFVYFFATIIGYLVDRLVFKTERGYGPAYYVTQIVAQIALSILASMLVMWFSRYREYRADRGGARLTGRHKMISALKALQRAQAPADMPAQLAAFGINGGGVGRFFMSHPPLEDRIAALEDNRR